MKLKESQQEFIKQAHQSSDVCSEWKTKIKDAFPKLFEEEGLELNKWYKTINRQTEELLFIEKVKGYSVYGYGFKYNAEWTTEGGWDAGGKVPATDKEVEQALIKEARKRGYKNGNYKCLEEPNKTRIIDYAEFEMINGNLCISERNSIYCNRIFCNGNWATIIETITKEQAEKELGKTIVG